MERKIPTSIPASAPARVALSQKIPSTSAGKKAEPAIENAQETMERIVPGFCAAMVAARTATTSSIDFDMTRRNWVEVVVIVVITIQAIAIQVILVDLSTRGDDVGGADVDNVGVAHNTIIEMIECELELTLDKEFLQLFHSGCII